MKRVETFQNRLKEIMNERHVNQTELSKRTNIKRTSINGYYVGDAEPNAEKILILSLELGVDPLWLMGYDVPKTKYTAKRNEIDLKLSRMTEKQLNQVAKMIDIILEED